ncbi:serpin family protein [Methanolobus bombayensis]|uniref:serpin family protein n=1 Tax=Methanolobus bombayensis TaxID=38023 RepID=UPI001AE5D3FB|nr:serpin family protein [Methanolobus bombayensis]MBP1909120.1 serpin B [Methanolobus bombayensis]
MSSQKLTIVLLMCLILSGFGCIDGTNSDSSTEAVVISGINADSVNEYDIATANNVFAFDMYNMIKSNDNTIFSPYSIFTAMAICYDGSAGSTQEQLSDVFYYPLDKQILEQSSQAMISTINSGNDQYVLNTANALWVQEDFTLESQYVYNAETYYDGKVESLDFIGETDESRIIINDWVENKTSNKIVDILSERSLSPDTRLVITNAVYFNGTWLNKFEEAGTRKRSFTLSSGPVIDVDTMFVADRFNYGKGEYASILELPYKGGDISMYVILPASNNIGDFESSFTFDDYNELKNSMSEDNILEIWMPKYTFETKTQLNDPLQSMGIVDAFNSGVADFSGISDMSLSISDVIHQAYIGVNEKGTEAAAATNVVMEEEEILYDVQLLIDHPFLFFIEDKRTGCILFMGKVEDPSVS